MFKPFIRVLLLTVILIIIYPDYALGQEQDVTNLQWLTYADSRFDFTIQYPMNWTVQPRSDEPGTMGEVLTFHSPSLPNGQMYDIVVGQYLYSIRASESLSEWTDRYNQKAGDVFDSLTSSSLRKNIQVDNSEALFIRGASLTEFQSTNIRRGETVWFIWTNIRNSTDVMQLQIYEHMLASLKFGPQSPLTLSDISRSKFRDEPAHLPTTGAGQANLRFISWISIGSMLLLIEVFFIGS